MSNIPKDIHDYKVGRFEQSAWGTGAVEASAVVQVDCEPMMLEAPINIYEGEAISATRELDEVDIKVDTYGVMPEFQLSGYMSKIEMAHQLYSFFQNVSEGATTPYAKTFTFPTTQPDFTANGGYFAAYVFESPDASESYMVRDCITKELTFSCEPSGRIKTMATIVGRGAVDIDFNHTGTFTRNALNTWRYENMATASIGAAVSLVGGWELKLTQEVAPFGIDSGDFESFVISKRRGLLTTTVLRNAQGLVLEGYKEAGTFVDVDYKWGTGSTDNDFTIDYHGYISKAAITTEAPVGVALEIPMIRRQAATAIEPITIIVADAVDCTW